jgi:hypothetical protein
MVPSVLFMRRSAHPFRFGTVDVPVRATSDQTIPAIPKQSSLSVTSEGARFLALAERRRSIAKCAGERSRTSRHLAGGPRYERDGVTSLPR